jgi:hypothetical protein
MWTAGRRVSGSRGRDSNRGARVVEQLRRQVGAALRAFLPGRRCVLAALVLAGPLLGGSPLGVRAPSSGGTPASGALERLERSVTRPAPVAPRSPAPRPDQVWVPDRYVPAPGAPEGLFVPGHWERRLSEREFYVGPLVVCRPGTTDCRTIPAGVRGPVETRDGP